MAGPREKIRIGDLLVNNGIITNDQLLNALSVQKTKGGKLGYLMISLGYVSEHQFVEFLAQQLKIPAIDLQQFRYDTELAKRLPETAARRFRAMVLRDEKNRYLVGMADPTDLYGYDELCKLLKRPIDMAVVIESELLRTLDMVYRRTQDIKNIAVELNQELTAGIDNLEQLLIETDVEDAPVVRLLRSLFEDAVQMGASDIHIEPDEKVLRIRQRVDGVLSEQVMQEKRIAPALVSRLKLVCGLDISEKRLPLDGRFNIMVKKRSIDVRLSTMPTQFGEVVVMRLLDQSGGVLGLEKAGMTDQLLQRFRKHLHSPHGLILVTGPTGSGKTTTLYGALNELNVPEKKIITVEDPVEYRLPRINQVQIHQRIGLDFARVLRSGLRQDPDIIMVGEMRDAETAEIALRAAMTGHLVLSTLHTNDAISTALRLLDMGAKGFLVASSLRAVLAQRLVRRICDRCSNLAQPDSVEQNWLDAVAPGAKVTDFRVGSGCALCNNKGYRGRIGIFELLEIDSHLADALRSGDSQNFAARAAQQQGFTTLGESALKLAQQGTTTLAEVMRISGQVDELIAQPFVPVNEA